MRSLPDEPQKTSHSLYHICHIRQGIMDMGGHDRTESVAIAKLLQSDALLVSA